jgi:hypothetical protein
MTASPRLSSASCIVHHDHLMMIINQSIIVVVIMKVCPLPVGIIVVSRKAPGR